MLTGIPQRPGYTEGKPQLLTFPDLINSEQSCRNQNIVQRIGNGKPEDAFPVYQKDYFINRYGNIRKEGNNRYDFGQIFCMEPILYLLNTLRRQQQAVQKHNQGRCRLIRIYNSRKCVQARYAYQR